MAGVYNGVPLPREGAPIRYENEQYQVPDNPIIPFIEGDGTGRDIWKASRRVFDAAVEKAYGGKRRVSWYEIFAGEKAFSQFRNWFPEDSLRAAKDLRVSIKGPLTTPVGGGIHVYDAYRDEKYVLTVENSGAGISKEKISKIFNKQYSSESGTMGEKGLGLGLKLCLQLLEKNGGKLEVESPDAKRAIFRIIM